MKEAIIVEKFTLPTNAGYVFSAMQPLSLNHIPYETTKKAFYGLIKHCNQCCWLQMERGKIGTTCNFWPFTSLCTGA